MTKNFAADAVNYDDINPYLDLPTKHVSDASIKSLDPHDLATNSEGLKFDPTAKPINLEPPAGDAFRYLLDSQWYRKLRGIFLLSTYPRIHGSAFRSHYGVYQERTRQLASYPWMIHPYSTFRWCWDIMVSICLIITLVVQPILIAFYEDDLRKTEHIIISCVQGGIFFVDIILNFRTGYISPHCDTINLDDTVIFWHYMKTWFFIDLLSTIPYDAIFLVLDDVVDTKMDVQAYKYIRLLELLKIFRLVRVIRYISRFQEAYMIDALYVRVINLHIVIFFTLHWNGCLHYLAADMFNSPDDPKPLSWVTRMELWNATVSFKYINAIVRAVSNMACLGYGTEVPRETEDIVCTIFSIMVGATFFALFIGNLSSILINVDVAQKKYAEVLNQVTEYMKFKQIPKELQNRVILYYEHRYRRNFFNETNILLSLSDVLRQELQMFNCRRLVEEVPLFHGLPAMTVQNIVGRLQFEVYLPQDIVIGHQTIGDSMYFIEHGAVTVLAPSGRAVAHLRDGDFFGEMALITNERRNATVIATSYCDMYRLDRDDFEDAVRGYPEVYDLLVKYAEERAKKSSTDNGPAQGKGKYRQIHYDNIRYMLPAQLNSGEDLLEDDEDSSATNNATRKESKIKLAASQNATKDNPVVLTLLNKDKNKPKRKRGSGGGSITDIDF